MADISITRLGDREFRVDVDDGEQETSHRVTVPARLGRGLVLGEEDLERAVRESFEFLLEREPASSILSRFSLSDISGYFPEYDEELPRRLGRGPAP